MTMTIEKKLRDFHFWGGAASNAAKLTSEELDTMEEYMEHEICSNEEPWSTTEVNDCFWFQFEDVCEWLGLEYEEVMAR
jgi:hypothetical protein